MASVQDYKRRIRSVRNTRKITRALELVAAAKLRRAQVRIEAMRPYADTMRELISGVGRAAGSVRWLGVGKKGRSTLTFRRRTLDGAFVGFMDAPAYADAQVIAHRAAELFVEGEVD